MKKEIVSIIIPIYNASQSIMISIKCLMAQSFPFDRQEVILVDDGSMDDSLDICRRIARWHRNIHVFHQENKGVSAARNLGLEHAKGKYIFFLDADDELSPETVENCVNFFDSVGEETDLVTYPIETIYKGKVLKPHFRYRYLKESRVYNLCDNAFIGQTTMNIVVRNKFADNILFDEDISFSEDQKYCCDVMAEKLTMGFCKEAKYIYYRGEESASGRLAGACFIFEQCMNFFEEIFSRYEHVPMAFQGLYVNDIAWKMTSNIFFPYHYDEKRYAESMARVKALLQKCYNSVILDHPAIDYYEKHYLMRLKGTQYVTPKLFHDGIAIYSEGFLVYKQSSIEMVITKFSVSECKVKVSGFLKSVFFQYYDDRIDLVAIENEKQEKRLELSPSVHNYYRSHEPTQRFWKFDYACDVKQVYKLSFEVHFKNYKMPVHYYFMPLTPFSHKFGDYLYSKDSVKVLFEDNAWSFGYTDKLSKEQVWLYYDCKGVACDNGLLQFLHDYEIGDGVKRYYVVSDDKQREYLPDDAERVDFGTYDHLMLILRADKIITAFIENNNIFPNLKSDYDYERYSNQFSFEVIYLQHGILHIDMPWKYSPEKIIADKVVVSAEHEAELFIKNGFNENDLWCVGMPRFDILKRENDKSTKKKRILFAPSWRSYLIGDNVDGIWQPLLKKFESSSYYKGIVNFLKSERLEQLCLEYGYQIDVKFHPIFSCYYELMEINKSHIFFVENVYEEDYDLLITDFSSYMFDFIYLNIPVLSYIPDMDEFKCGMNGYRRVDFMDKVDKKYLCSDYCQIIDRVSEFFETGRGMEYNVHFFENKKGESRDAIYHMLIEEYDI